MPKAGKYEYPINDIDAVIEKLRKLHENLREDEMDRAIAADTIGMSVSGGAYAYLISDMEKYGFVKTGAKKIVITDLGKIVLYGEDSEKERVKNQAVMNIALFKDLYNQYGEKVTEEQMRAFLRQKALMDIVKAQKTAPKVDKIYKNVAKYIVSAEKLERPQVAETNGVPSQVGRRFDTQTGDSKKDLLKIQYGSLYLEVEKDDAENALKMVAQKLGLKLVCEKSD